jgi:hypothetical protein
VLKQVGIVLAVAVVVLALILLLTFVINGPSRMLTSEELALEQTRISLNIFIKQTEVAGTSTAGLYLTLGVPFPTETPFIVPTSGSLGRPITVKSPDSGTRVAISTSSIISTTAEVKNIKTSTQVQSPITITPTPSPSMTSKPPNNLYTWWAGEWNPYYLEAGALTGGDLTITVKGDSITGNVEFHDGYPMVLSGEVSMDGKRVTGTYTSKEGSGQFYWERINDEQFGGNLDGDKGFCATRNKNIETNKCLIQQIP